MRTLLLEDDDAARMVYGKCIENAGHEVVEASTIDRALTILRTSRIDLLVIDLLIGNTNSLSLASYASYAAPQAEVILITGSGQFPNGEVISEFPSINWVLRKPLAMDDLTAFIEYASHRASQRAPMTA